ncbi:MAG: 4-hydroxy-tetrahydrodipicolinate synthase [Akkermansiaceae bacterium]|nr:4-hydroxy-tetrahydrodipicolinate synthase [Akkermansiaceae bacterium]
MFTGTYTALITPFRDGDLDVEAFRTLIDRQADAGIDGIVPVGTTGESPTLSTNEHLEVVKYAVEFSAGRMKVLAGTGANSTREAIHLTKEAERLGADGSLQVCPYYNKPSQEGLYQHFKAIADETSLPIMLYSIPGRSVIQIDVETTVRLANDCSNIVSIKEAGGSVDRVNQLIQAVPEGFEVACGDDPLTLPFMACGAVCLVSVTANLAPDVMARIVRACANGSFDEALELQKRYYPLMSTLMSLDTNPVPIKSAVSLLGLCTSEFRRPLVPLSADKLQTLKTCLSDFELL